jgi:hypothetical protein
MRNAELIAPLRWLKCGRSGSALARCETRVFLTRAVLTVEARATYIAPPTATELRPVARTVPLELLGYEPPDESQGKNLRPSESSERLAV